MITDVEKNRIQGAIDREYARSVVKHGNWDDLDYFYMREKILDEMEEVIDAAIINDHYGEHGTFNELAQVAACAIKAMVQILRREGGTDDKNIPSI